MDRRLVILAVVIGGALGAWEVMQQRVRPSYATTEEFIAFLSDQAVSDADTYDHVKLDYGVDSLKQVDQILGHVHDSYVKNPASISLRGLSAEYGAYVGEVIRRNHPNTYWTRDSKVAGDKSYPLHWKAGESYPIQWCSERITNGDEDSIWIKYSVLQDSGWKQHLANAAQHSNWR